MKSNFDCRLLIVSRIPKNKKFLAFVKEFCFIFNLNSVNGFTYSLEKIIMKYPKISLELGFSHSLFFFSNKNRNFLQISKSPYGPILTFIITKFAIRKEINKLNFPVFLDSPILLLNNLHSDKNNLQIVSTLIRQLFPNKTLQGEFFKKHSEGILFDFNSNHNKIEVRIYKILGFSTLVPRALRKTRKKNKTDLYIKSNFEKTSSILQIKNKKKVDFIRIIEIGPRFTLQQIDLRLNLNFKTIK